MFVITRRLLGALGSLKGHAFSSHTGLCTPTNGGIIVANKLCHQMTLFPHTGSPICLLSQRLGQSVGVALELQNQLLVADARSGFTKIFQEHPGPPSLKSWGLKTLMLYQGDLTFLWGAESSTLCIQLKVPSPRCLGSVPNSFRLCRLRVGTRACQPGPWGPSLAPNQTRQAGGCGWAWWGLAKPSMSPSTRHPALQPPVAPLGD